MVIGRRGAVDLDVFGRDAAAEAHDGEKREKDACFHTEINMRCVNGSETLCWRMYWMSLGVRTWPFGTRSTPEALETLHESFIPASSSLINTSRSFSASSGRVCSSRKKARPTSGWKRVPRLSSMNFAASVRSAG